jgi:hypothetical protein
MLKKIYSTLESLGQIGIPKAALHWLSLCIVGYL